MKEFGSQLLGELFLLKPGLCNFNHGSFGTVPKPVMKALVELLHQEESFPDEWFRETYLAYLVRSREAMAKLICANLEDVVMVENASYAVNSVLRSFPFQRGDKVLVFSSAYRMVVDTLLFLQQLHGIEIVKVDLIFPIAGPEVLVDLVKSTLASTLGIKLCIFSHISSMPTLIEPVKALTAVAKASGCVVMVDGAHAPGILDIDVNDIGADLYTGNCHKWLFAPKACAFLWVSAAFRARFENAPQPVVISSTGWYDYEGRFAYTGTRDYTALCALPKALAFIEEELGGIDRMRRYCKGLLKEGCDLLVQTLGTSYLVPWEMHGVMANVVLPMSLDKANELQAQLNKEHGMYVVVGSVQAEDGKELAFMRISAQVYLEMSDFRKLASVVKKLLALES